MKCERGVTLLELIVAVALLGIIAAIVTVQMPRRPLRSEHHDDPLLTMRQQAVAEGRPITTVVHRDTGDTHIVTALPDGRVLGDSGVEIDAPLRGNRATP